MGYFYCSTTAVTSYILVGYCSGTTVVFYSSGTTEYRTEIWEKLHHHFLLQYLLYSGLGIGGIFLLWYHCSNYLGFALELWVFLAAVVLREYLLIFWVGNWWEILDGVLLLYHYRISCWNWMKYSTVVSLW